MKFNLKSKLNILIVLFLIFPKNIFADINGDLNHFFNNLGYAQNYSKPTAYKAQQAGFYAGGSMFLRNQVRNYQIASIDLPKINAGCGGIDFHLGGLSFINGEGIKNLVKNIMAGAAGYTAELALEQALPQATNVMRHMQDIANKVNQFNLNSCTTAAQIVGALGLKTQESQKNVCESAAISQGLASNWTDARELCRNPDKYNQIMDIAQNNAEYKSLVIANTNLAWKALMSNNFIKHDTQLAQLFMSLSGSIIRESGSRLTACRDKYLPSLVDDRNLIKALLKGGKANIWACDNFNVNGCLNPVRAEININPNLALESQILNLLEDILNKIAHDAALTSDEIGFLQTTHLPIYKILNVQAAYQSDRSVLDVTSYSETIAADILYQYLLEALSEIKIASASFQYPPSVLETFICGVNQAIQAVRTLENSAYKNMAANNSLIERSQIAEKMLAGSLSNEIYNNLKWNN